MNLHLFNNFQFIAVTTFIEIHMVLSLTPEPFYITLVVLLVSFLTHNTDVWGSFHIFSAPDLESAIFQEVLVSFCVKGYFRTTVWLLEVFLGLFSILNIYIEMRNSWFHTDISAANSGLCYYFISVKSASPFSHTNSPGYDTGDYTIRIS